MSRRAHSASENRVTLFAGAEAEVEVFGVYGDPFKLVKTSPPPPACQRRGALITKGPLEITATQAREIAYIHIGTYSYPIMPRAYVWRTSAHDMVFAQPSPGKFWRVRINANTTIQKQFDTVMKSVCNYHAGGMEIEGSAPEDVLQEDPGQPRETSPAGELGPSPLVRDAIEVIKTRAVRVSSASHTLSSASGGDGLQSASADTTKMPGKQEIPEVFNSPASCGDAASHDMSPPLSPVNRRDGRSSPYWFMQSPAPARSMHPSPGQATAKPEIDITLQKNVSVNGLVAHMNSEDPHSDSDAHDLDLDLAPLPLTLQSPENSGSVQLSEVEPVPTLEQLRLESTPPHSPLGAKKRGCAGTLRTFLDHQTLTGEAFLPSPVCTPIRDVQTVFIATPDRDVVASELDNLRNLNTRSLSESSTLDEVLDMFEDEEEFGFNYATGNDSNFNVASATPSIVSPNDPVEAEPSDDTLTRSTEPFDDAEAELGTPPKQYWHIPRIRFSHPLIPASKSFDFYPAVPDGASPLGSTRVPLYGRDLVRVGTHSMRHDVTTVSGYVSWHLMSRFMSTFRKQS